MSFCLVQMSFSRNIGTASSLMAELWAIRDGLMLCVGKNMAMVEIELDAKAVVDMLRNPQYSNRSFSSLLEDCRKLIYEIPQVRIKHCYREANGCADFMARKGSVQGQSFLVFESSPEDMIGFVEADMSGASASRRCPELSVSP